MITLFAIYLIAQTQVCTVSLNFDTPTYFEYAGEAIVLNVPEYNNDYTKTAGFGGCFTGTKLIGYTDTMPTGGFAMDEQGNELNIEI